MSAKKNILVLCDWFLPGYLAGGPIRSVATLTKQLKDDLHFKIITTDRDFGSVKRYDGIEANVWTTYQGQDVFYISPENLQPDFIFNLIQQTPHETIYLNSLFSKLFTLYPLKWKRQGKLKSNLVLAPRGMLRDGALAVKPFKKKVFLFFARYTGLFKDVHWQSTSAQETDEIKKQIGQNVRITEVSNLPDLMNGLVTPIEKKKGSLRLCFIARILDIKNLNFAINVLKDIAEQEIVFDIYGPKEDAAYWGLCEANAQVLPKNISFHYKGVLTPDQIGKTLSQYHALFLPTHTENFGHIIVETLQHGRPVLISDQTPWLNLEKEQVGFDICLKDKGKFKKSIEVLSQMDQAEYDTISEKCLVYIIGKLNVLDIKQKYLQLFST